MNTETILLLEDDVMLLEANAGFLEMAGFRVLACKNEEEAWAAVRKETPDIMVLDVVLEKSTGLDFCREYRKEYGNGTPALFLTVMQSALDVAAGYEVGGVDYLIKPVKIENLTVKIRALLDNVKAVGEEIVLGRLRLDCVSKTASLDGKDLLLMPKEYSVLEYLARNRNKAVAAATVYEKVWRQPMNGDDRAVKKAVSRLRKKLENSGYTIHTGRGEGYCFERV